MTETPADTCELCRQPIARGDYCDGCLEDPDEYAPRHARCCEAAETRAALGTL